MAADRFQISQRLHDEVCQTLAATAYMAAILKKNLQADSPEEASQADEVCAGVRAASLKLRDLMEDLRRPLD